MHTSNSSLTVHVLKRLVDPLYSVFHYVAMFEFKLDFECELSFLKYLNYFSGERCFHSNKRSYQCNRNQYEGKSIKN